jgi:hypothetical protein
MRSFRTVAGIFALLAPWIFEVHAHEETEIIVGRSAAGELKFHLHFTQPVEIEKSIYPGISGYATAAVAFHSTIPDEPDDDFFQLSTGADFRFVLLAKDSGMEIWNDTGTGYMSIGEMFFIGPSPFDNHPVWNLVNGTPGNAYSLTMKLRDANSVYPDSTPFTLSFTPAGYFKIELARIDSQQALISWPTNAVDWELQSAVIATATNWNAVTNVPDLSGTNFLLSIPMTGKQQFFRLHKHSD